MKGNIFISILGVVVFAGILLVGCKACNKTVEDPKPPPEIRQANKNEGIFLLRNLAMAEITYSAVQGSKGTSKFTGDPQKLAPYASAKAIAAIVLDGNKENPLEGYVVLLKEKTPGDNFTTDFCIEARPAEGYCGKIMQISKDEKIIEIEE